MQVKIKLPESQDYLPKGVQNKKTFILKNISMGPDHLQKTFTRIYEIYK